MSKTRIRPKTKERFRKAIRNIVDGLSRKVTIYRQPVKSECPNCFFDKMTNRSTGKCKWTFVEASAKQYALGEGAAVRYKWFKFGRCPICFGQGYLETQRKTWAKCLVTWNPAERGGGNEMMYTPAGTEGSTIVRLKTNPNHFNDFKNCEKLVIDGVECKVARPPVMRGLGTQAILVITAFTTEKPAIDSGEIVKDYG
jgi:hypothetical protein